MKKVLYSLSAILFAAAAFTSCSKENDAPVEQTSELKTYTLTIEAAKSVDTKQLVLEGSTLNAVWAAGEVVKVYKGSSEIGTLSPTTTGSASTVLTGTVTVAGLAAEDWIDLVFGGDLSAQDGSLANVKDWAKAWFQVGSIEGTAIVPKTSEGTADASGNVLFNNWTSIVRFNVKKGGANLNVSDLTLRTVSGDLAGSVDKKLTITPASATNSLFVSLSNYSGDTPVVDDYEILVTSAEDGLVYSCTAANKTFLRGKYYDITLNVTTPVYSAVGGPNGVFSSTQWDPSATEGYLSYDGGTGLYSKSFAVANPDTVEFKVVRNHAFASGSWPASNYQFVFPSSGTITVSFNPLTNEVTATGVTDKVYTVAGTSTQAGVFSVDWAPTDDGNDMTLKSDGSYFKLFPNIKKDATLTFKVCEDHGWSSAHGYVSGKTNCTDAGAPDHNCQWTATKDCDIRIYINPGSGHYIYVEEV